MSHPPRITLGLRGLRPIIGAIAAANLSVSSISLGQVDVRPGSTANASTTGVVLNGATLERPIGLGIGQMYKLAETVVVGRVAGVQSGSLDESIKTRITIDVDQVLKDEAGYVQGEGQGRKILQFEQLGGQAGSIGSYYSHVPVFFPDEEVLLFLKRGKGSVVTPVLGRTWGKLGIEKDKSTSKRYVLGVTLDIPLDGGDPKMRPGPFSPNRIPLDLLSASLRKFSDESGEPYPTAPNRFINVMNLPYIEQDTRQQRPGWIEPPKSDLTTTQSNPNTLCTIRVTYNNVPAAQAEKVRNAVGSAVTIWESLLSSEVPIQVNVTWIETDLGVLGSGGATTYKRDFPGAKKSSTWYPIALANKLAGRDLEPFKSDIELTINGTSNWYCETDGQTPSSQYDLMSVTLHNIVHGLGFISSMSVKDSLGSWGLGDGGIVSPSIFDHFLRDELGKSLLETAPPGQPSKELAKQLTSGKIYFDGRIGKAANKSELPLVYAPQTWRDGYSLCHLCNTTYEPGDPNSLMSPEIGKGEAIHNPGSITIGILRDLGW